MDGRSVGVGIVGLGRSGWDIHAAAVANTAGLRVAAVADKEASRRQEAVGRFGCRAYEGHAEMLRDPDVSLAVVSTPSHTHAAIAIEAMEAGKDVLVEKPMALNVEEADRMIAASEKTGRRLIPFQNRRFDPDFLQVREIVEGGLLGDVFLVRMCRHGFKRRSDWQTLSKFGGGMLNNWGAHVVDQALLLMGKAPDQLFCDLRRTVSAGDAEDHVKIVMKSGEGMVIDIEIASASAFPAPVWTVTGTLGGLQGSPSLLEVRRFEKGTLPELTAEEGPAPGRSYGDPEPIPWIEETVEAPRSDGNLAFYGRLASALTEGAPLPAEPQSVRLQLEVLERCRRLAGFE